MVLYRSYLFSLLFDNKKVDSLACYIYIFFVFIYESLCVCVLAYLIVSVIGWSVIKRILDECLLISSLPGKALRTLVEL